MKSIHPVCLFLFAIILNQLASEISALDPAPATLKVMTWNVEWMYDDNKSDNRSDLAREQSAPSKEYWQWKVSAVAEAIAKSGAWIVALQEIEGDQTLAAIIGELREKHQLSYRYAFIQGMDSFTEQDVGLLYRDGLTEFRRHEQSRTMYDSQQYYNLSKHLVAVFRWSNVASPLTLMTTHFRATEEAEALRVRQARLARFWLQPALEQSSDVLLVGDLNAEPPAGQLRAEMQMLVDGPEPVTNSIKLFDLLEKEVAEKRRTHLILDKQYDRLLASPSLMSDESGQLDWVFESIAVRGDLVIRGAGPDGETHWQNRLSMPLNELDTSDHFPVIATFQLK